MKEITFLVKEAEEGGYYAEALGFGVFAGGNDTSKLKGNIKRGIDYYFKKKRVPLPLLNAFC